MWRFPTIIPVQDTDSQQQLPIDAIFKTAENSTVGIITGSNDGPNPEFDGTGFVYDIRGDMLYKVTSAHVVEGFDEVEVSFIDGSTHTAEVKGINPKAI
jgi:S1-C subfamily serine protease